MQLDSVFKFQDSRQVDTLRFQRISNSIVRFEQRQVVRQTKCRMARTRESGDPETSASQDSGTRRERRPPPVSRRECRPACPSVSGTNSLELLPDLPRKAGNIGIAEIDRDPAALGIPHALDLALLLGDIACVLELVSTVCKTPLSGLSPKPVSIHSRSLTMRRLRPAKPDATSSDDPPSNVTRRPIQQLVHASLLLLLPLIQHPSARSSTNPISRPIGVSRSSALSIRRCRRNSAREVNIRYGSSAPLVTRSPIRMPDIALGSLDDDRIRTAHERAPHSVPRSDPGRPLPRNRKCR